MKTVTGYFKSFFNAKKTYREMKGMGVKSVEMDIIDRFSEGLGDNHKKAMSGDKGSLSYLALKAGAGDIPMEQRPLYAADPNVSGMGGFEELADASVVLSVIIDDSEEESKIIDLIKENEGEI